MANGWPAVLVASLLAATTYPDRAGDVKGASGGADIVSMTISSTKSTLTFRVRFAKAPPLRVSTAKKWVDMLLIGIDVPPLGPKPQGPGGEWPGLDYALGTHGPSKTVMLVRSGGQSRPARFRLVTKGATLTFSIPRKALGNPAWFTFSAAAAREGATEGGIDLVPDRGTARYTPH